jgi:P27 family predicted phage terminase small subunit
VEVPEAPSDLGPAGAATWERLWCEQPQLADGDRLAVERLARLEDEASALRECMRRDGPLVTRPLQNSRGEVIGEESFPHPALTPLRKIGSEAGLLCTQLGLTPAGRQALGLDVLTAPGEPDELDRLKERRQRRRAQMMRRSGGGA